VKRYLSALFSIIVGWVLASFLHVGLLMIGINIPAELAVTYSQYSTYTGVEILILTLGLSWAMYKVLGRRFLEPTARANSPLGDRLKSSIRHPSVLGLIVAWVIAVCTVIVYPVAIYMSWRLFSEWRDGQTKVCPRFAERIKAAALVCRHCGQQLDANVAQPVTSPVV